MKTVTFFDDVTELLELTGLPGDNNYEALWNNGFDLDDWDFGFVSDTEWSEAAEPYFEFWLMMKMETFIYLLQFLLKMLKNMSH